MRHAPLGWVAIVRLGLVQSAIGAIVMLATSLLNRVMVVEYALLAALPAGLVAWHYAVQLSRPAWGHGSDRGRRRTPWIIVGMGMLAMGALLAVNALGLIATGAIGGYALAIVAYRDDRRAASAPRARRFWPCWQRGSPPNGAPQRPRSPGS